MKKNIHKKLNEIFDTCKLIFYYFGLLVLLAGIIANIILNPSRFGSNLLTMVLTIPATFLAFLIAKTYIANSTKKLDEKSLLQEEIEKQKKEITKLKSDLDFKMQVESAPSIINLAFKIEQAEYTKKAYIVREDSLEDNLSNDEAFKENIPSNSLIEAVHGKRHILSFIGNITKYASELTFKRLNMLAGTVRFSFVV